MLVIKLTLVIEMPLYSTKRTDVHRSITLAMSTVSMQTLQRLSYTNI